MSYLKEIKPRPEPGGRKIVKQFEGFYRGFTYYLSYDGQWYWLDIPRLGIQRFSEGAYTEDNAQFWIDRELGSPKEDIFSPRGTSRKGQAKRTGKK